MTVWTVVGILLVLGLIVAVGLLSGKKVRDSKDFVSGGGKAGPFLVSGAIMGALVGSQATIGTAQLAFHYGLAAWWFTLGSGIGCLLLGLLYTKPLRASGCITEMQIISREYGSKVGSTAAILSVIGIFISVLSNVIACTGLISAMFPSLSNIAASLATVAIMAVYVIFGGAWGAGMGGVAKMILLYCACIAGMICALVMSGGVGGLIENLKALLGGTDLGMVQQAANKLPDITDAGQISGRYLNLIGRGVSKDVGSGISLLLGVLSTQTYAQAIWSGKSDRAAKRGALLSAGLIPPLGIAGICIGMFMRSRYLLQSEVDALTAAGLSVPDMPVLSGTIQVFPTFVLDHLPSVIGGIVIGTLLITAVAGGAGLAFGMATILVKDIFNKLSKRPYSVWRELEHTRLTIGGILLSAAAVAIAVPGSTINDFGFLSMGLRGSAVFVPLTCALWLHGKIDSRWVMASVICAPLSILVGKMLPLPFDALFLGVGVSLLLCLMGLFTGKKTELKSE